MSPFEKGAHVVFDGNLLTVVEDLGHGELIARHHNSGCTFRLPSRVLQREPHDPRRVPLGAWQEVPCGRG